MYSTFLREPKLLGFAYDLEQAMSVRETAAVPRFSDPGAERQSLRSACRAASCVLWNSEDAGARPHLLN